MTSRPDAPDEGPAPSLSARTGRQGALTLVALIANGCARVASSLVVGRIAGPVSLGLFQTAVSAAQLAGLFGPAALGSAASRFVARGRAAGDVVTLRAVQSHLLLRLLQSALLVVALGAPVWLLVPRHDVSSAVGFVVLVTAFGLYTFTRGLAYGMDRANRAAAWNIVCSVVGVVVLTSGAVLGARLEELLLLFSLSYFLFAAANWDRVRPRRLASPLGREIDRFTLFAVAGTLTSAGFLDATMVLAGAIGDPDAVGQFGAAFALATPAALIGAAATLVLYPVLSAVGSEDRAAQRRIVDTSSRSLATVVVAIFATVLLLRHHVVGLLFGPDFGSAATLLPPLLLAVMLTTLAIPATSALTALSEHGIRTSAISSAVGLAIGATVWATTIPLVGLSGVAYGFLAGTLVASAVPFVLTWRTTRQSWARHAVTLVVGTCALALLSAVQEVWNTSAGLDIALLLGFLLGWSLACRSEVRWLSATCRRMVTR